MQPTMNATAQIRNTEIATTLPEWNRRVYTTFYEGLGFRFESDCVLSEDELRKILEQCKERLGWKIVSKVNKERWLRIEAQNATQLMLLVWLVQQLLENGLTIEAFLSSSNSIITNDANAIVPFMQMWTQEMAKNAPFNL